MCHLSCSHPFIWKLLFDKPIKILKHSCPEALLLSESAPTSGNQRPMIYGLQCSHFKYDVQDEYNRKVLKSLAKKCLQNDFSRGK